MNDRHDQSLYPAGTDATDIDARQSSHPAAQARSFQRQSPHVTQTPIDDVEPQYVTRERYVTLDQAQGQGRRRHMGVATSNPSYLPKTEMQMRLDAERMAAEPRQPAHRIQQPSDPNQPRALTNSSRYLQTPKPGRSIFTTQRDRERRKHKLVLALIAIVVVLLIVWFFFLR